MSSVLIWSAAPRYSATPLSFPIDSITSQSGVAEYLATALQIKTPPHRVVEAPDRFFKLEGRTVDFAGGIGVSRRSTRVAFGFSPIREFETPLPDVLVSVSTFIRALEEA